MGNIMADDPKPDEAAKANDEDPLIDKTIKNDDEATNEGGFCSPWCLLSTTFIIILIDFLRHIITLIVIFVNTDFERLLAVAYLVLLLFFLGAGAMVCMFFLDN